jgi:hypothetical protein
LASSFTLIASSLISWTMLNETLSSISSVSLEKEREMLEKCERDYILRQI